jgi:ABC-type glycerol-3-phosphate transport system substrate-binding protein
MWSDFLLRRAVGEQVLCSTIEGRGPRFDADPRYRAALQAVRDLHQPGWFMPGWEGSQWPAAQRRWVNGEATHLICGSWLIRETLTYNFDPAKFRLGAFPVPMIGAINWGQTPPQPLGDPTGVDAYIAGHALLNGGKNRAGAVKLLNYLARRKSAGILSEIGKEIPPVRGAPFPAELQELRPDFEAAKTVYDMPVPMYAPKWGKFIWADLYHQFFMHETPSDPLFLSVDEFLRRAQAETDKYQRAGGEAGIK